ncbi:MAG: UvrB/UvrC motif-containing protein [Planctomycetaceae bacterium]|nr:UvrB/UvrC motif-containing protein [Planctomycetaceae bacterium]
MKCQKCNKEATFHISELMGSEPKELHLCEEHAREYLNQSAIQGKMAGNLNAMLSQGLPQKISLNKAAKELQELDQQTCSICGISFHDLRSQGCLGCPHDYEFFGKQIDAFILNIHGVYEHTGKVPVRKSGNSQERMLLIKFRRDLDDAVQYEDYERASKLRDKINSLERELG